MYGLANRAYRLIGDLEGMLYRPLQSISGIEMRRGKLSFPCQLSQIREGFVPFENGGLWAEGEFDHYALFRFTLSLPECPAGEDLYLRVETNQSGHNMVKPQMLIYREEEALQGLDTNHRRLRVTDLAGGRETFYVYAFCGLGHKTPYGGAIDLCGALGVRLSVALETRNQALADCVFSLKTAYAYLSAFSEGSYEHGKILGSISDALTLLDLRHPHSPELYASAQKAGEHLQKTLFEETHPGFGSATLIGHTHIDLAWLWQYHHTKDKALRSFATEVKLLSDFPEHRFMSSQAQLYEFVKEQDSALYEKIRALVKEGRWEAEGAMWVEPDMNLSSGESIVRQILYGKRFFREEFGVDCKVLWLPDVFGYSAALPQILKKSGVSYFMTAKLGTNEKNRFPHDTFLWQGLDGTKILSHLISYLPGVYNPNVEGTAVLAGWRNYAEKHLNEDILVPFGFADGGGGPTEEQIETVRRMKNGLPGVPSMRFDTVGNYFRRLEERVLSDDRLPTWAGEIYYERHRGTYTSMARVKKQNRRCEFLYRDAEWLSVLSGALGGFSFPKEAMEQGRKKMLLNQFHDVLPGTSIGPVYEDSDALYREAFATGEAVKEGAIAALTAPGEGVTVWNPHGWEAGGYVSYLGASYYVPKVPAMGYVALSPAQLAAHSTGGVTLSGDVIESPYYRIRLSPEGGIASLYDKEAERECFQEGQVANRLRIFEDKPGLLSGYREDNWNLDSYYTLKEFPLAPPTERQVLERSGEQVRIRTLWRYENSTLRQDMVVYAHSPRIDFETEVDWKETGAVIKAEFPVDVNARRATYEIQFGHIERPTTRNTSWEEAQFEVCGHKWADISDGGYGMALLNDCKYGYSALGSTLSLTLLRSGDSPYPEADKERHRFTYAILPHRGDHNEGRVPEEAFLLNDPLFVRPGIPVGQGQCSLFSCQGAILDTVKPAEDGDGVVLRLYEGRNAKTPVRIRSDLPIESAVFTDLLEVPTGDAPTLVDNEISFTASPFEILTLRVKVKGKK